MNFDFKNGEIDLVAMKYIIDKYNELKNINLKDNMFVLPDNYEVDVVFDAKCLKEFKHYGLSNIEFFTDKYFVNEEWVKEKYGDKVPDWLQVLRDYNEDIAI